MALSRVWGLEAQDWPKVNCVVIWSWWNFRHDYTRVIGLIQKKRETISLTKEKEVIKLRNNITEPCDEVLSCLFFTLTTPYRSMYEYIYWSWLQSQRATTIWGSSCDRGQHQPQEHPRCDREAAAHKLGNISQAVLERPRVNPVERFLEGDDSLGSYITLNPKLAEQFWMPDIFIDKAKLVRKPVSFIQPAYLRLYNDSMVKYSSRMNYDEDSRLMSKNVR